MLCQSCKHLVIQRCQPCPGYSKTSAKKGLYVYSGFQPIAVFQEMRRLMYWPSWVPQEFNHLILSVSYEEKTTAIKPSTHHHETAHRTQQAQCAHEHKVKADPIYPVFLWHRATNCRAYSTEMSPTGRQEEGCVSKTNTSTRQTIWKE